MTKSYSPVFEDIDFDSELPLLPIRNMIMFPGAVVPLDVGREKSVAIINKLDHLDDQVIALFSQKDPEVDDPSEDDLYDVGCAVKVVKVLKHTSGNYSVIVQGISRIEVEEVLETDPFMKVKVRRIPEDDNGYDVELEALSIALKDTAKQVVSLLPELPKEAVELIDSIPEPNRLADLIAANIDTPPEDKYKILESIDIKTRMNQVMNLLTRQLEILKMRERINSQIKEEMGKNQREYVLRQQLKAIKEELGEDTDEDSDVENIERRIMETNLSKEASETIGACDWSRA